MDRLQEGLQHDTTLMLIECLEMYGAEENTIRFLKDIDETGYTYLGIIGEEIKHQEMKETIKKKYIKKLKAILKSKLNFGNTVKAINTWAVPVIRYSVGIADWRNSELRNMDRKTRKVLNM